jgi:predicted ribosomally synthesized peptide with SipW-like signal peptide
MIGRKRLLLAAGTLASVGAVIALATGVTFGLFSATESSGSNTFAAGTVSVAPGQTASVTCNTSNIVPGDSSPTDQPSCAYKVRYTGSVPANLAVDVSVTSVAGSGGTPLYDATAAGLQLNIADNNSTTYVSGTSYKDSTGASQTLTAGTPVTNLLVAKGVSADVADRTFTVNYSLPLSSGNGYQGGTAAITLTFHAVQSAHNASTGTVGRQDNSESWT